MKQFLCCPECRGELIFDDPFCACSACRKKFPIDDGIISFSPVDAASEQAMDHAVSTRDTTTANAVYYHHKAKSYEDDFSGSGMFDHEGSSARIDQALKEISKDGNSDLLVDLGCGTGNILNYARPYYRETLGVDISADMLRIAGIRGHNLIQADINKLPVRPDTASAVTTFSVLHHLSDHSRLFSEIHRILKTGGYYYSDWDPNGFDVPVQKTAVYSLAEKIQRRLKKHGGSESPGRLAAVENIAEFYKPFSNNFTVEGLVRKLKETGFGEVTPFYHNNGPCLGNGKIGLKDVGLHFLRMLVYLRYLKFSRKNIMPYFAIVARK